MIRPGIKKLFRLAFHRREDAARDVSEEMRLHLALRTEQLIGGGLAPDQAREAAERKFGSTDDVQRMMEESATHREVVMRKREWWESFTQDLRYVLRSLKRSPTFVISATLTLALGLGANAALFSVLDRLYLQNPAGVTAPERLRRFYQTHTTAQKETTLGSVMAAPDFLSVAAQVPQGSSIVGYRTEPKSHLGNDDDAPTGGVTWVLGDYFGVLGVRPVAGRNFSPEEVRAQNISPVAIVSSAYARGQFGSERDALDKTLDVGATRFTIIGVAPPGFMGTDLDPSVAWVPMNAIANQFLGQSDWWNQHGTRFIRSIMRTADDGVAASFPAIAAASIKRSTTFKDTASIGATFGSIKEMLSPTFNQSEEVIATRLAVVAFAILLIACANVANLLLSRALQRRREIGVRLALGISRARLMSQLLTESVVLATIGLLAALLMAAWCATALRHALLPTVQWGAPAVGWRTVGFGLVTALVAGLAAGLAPALHASRPNLTSILKGGSSDGGARRSTVRIGLLVSQIALSCVLLAGAGLFVRSLMQVESIDIGYDTNRIVFAHIDRRRGSSRTEAELGAILTEAGGRIEKIPGVERISYAYVTPMYGFSFESAFLPTGDTLPRPKETSQIISFISPGYFSSMGMRVLEGRDFAPEDRAGSEQILVVNATFAKIVWPGESAVGKCLMLRKTTEPCRRVVGVVSNAHFGGVIEKPSMLFYVPLLQEGDDGKPGIPGNIEIRTSEGRAQAVAADVTKLLKQMSGTGMRPTVQTFSEQLEPSLRGWKLGAALFTAAAVLALLVAAVGIYGTIAYTFSQRTQEIGVRIALGAQGSSIVALVLKNSVMIAAVGVVIGTAAAIWAGRFAKPLLYETSPNNPYVLGGVGLVLLAVAVLASLVPAMRAKRVDPMEALRAE